jgi:DNA repair protein RadC
MNPMENAMQNLSALSRAELIGALLAPVLPKDHPHADQVNDLESAYFGTAAVAIETSDTLLDHKLGVARELLMRDLRAQLNTGPVMNSPQTLRDWLRLHCAGLQHEVFIVLFLDAQGRLLSAVEMFRGTLTQTSVYPREIVKSALQRNAAAVALAHNHPSGLPEPSRADEFLTQNLKSALALVDVRVLDHFIVAGDQCVSFAERGLI